MKLRQKIALGLGIFYLVSVIGVAISLHFCCGKLSSVRFTETANCSICNIGKADKKIKESNRCCKNTTIEAKIKDSHELGTKINLPLDFSTQLFIMPVIAGFTQTALPKLFSRAENKAPPLSARLSLYAFNCVFRN